MTLIFSLPRRPSKKWRRRSFIAMRARKAMCMNKICNNKAIIKRNSPSFSVALKSRPKLWGFYNVIRQREPGSEHNERNCFNFLVLLGSWCIFVKCWKSAFSGLRSARGWRWLTTFSINQETFVRSEALGTFGVACVYMGWQTGGRKKIKISLDCLKRTDSFT